MDRTEGALIIGAGCLVLGFVAALALVPTKDSGYNVTTEREFICEDDGKLVERHVGVSHASLLNDSTGSWRIVYDEGEEAFYQQSSGETCKMEEYVAPAVVDDAAKILATKWGNGRG
jgi:hypothetical protein